jgi:hypothetical protein
MEVRNKEQKLGGILFRGMIQGAGLLLIMLICLYKLYSAL